MILDVILLPLLQMKCALRILYSLVAIVFLACTIVQFHHHDDDGSMCMRIHSDFCAAEAHSHAHDCPPAGEQMSQQHHHCPDSECSLHLDDTEISNINKLPANDHSAHSHSIMCAVLCACLSTFHLFNSQHSSWPKVQIIGHVISASGLGWALRAPPAA